MSSPGDRAIETLRDTFIPRDGDCGLGGPYRTAPVVREPPKPRHGDVRIVHQRWFEVQVYGWRFLWLGRAWRHVASYQHLDNAIKEAQRHRKLQRALRRPYTTVWENGAMLLEVSVDDTDPPPEVRPF